jgi:signal transduction histidine kinase
MSEAEASCGREVERAKLAAMKELAYGASHEINNPLANISARAQTLLRDEHDPDRRRALEGINQQALRAHEMISDLMLFARPPRLDLQEVDLLELAERVAAQSRADCERRAITIHVRSDAARNSTCGDPIQLEVALKALITNSMEAIGEQGAIDVQVERIDSPQFLLRLVVSDNGPGIPQKVREHLFDPFYSGREAGRGLGFGLSKAWRIVTAHGGVIRVESNGDAGATFVIELSIESAG